MTAVASDRLVRVGSLAELRAAGRLVVHQDRHTLCLFAEGDDVLVDLSPPEDPVAHQRKRLHDGLERNLSLVLAKATIALVEADPSGVDVFRAGLDFGVARRGEGWFRGLTTLTCFMNLVPRLDPGDRPVALYHGIADVASDSAMQPPHSRLDP